uniref:Ovule protein n=1 Tax=Brugia timori TaxID=42155 RepID=A0A0R3Q8J9_9BILA
LSGNSSGSGPNAAKVEGSPRFRFSPFSLVVRFLKGVKYNVVFIEILQSSTFSSL